MAPGQLDRNWAPEPADVLGRLLDRYDDTGPAAILDFVRGVNGQGSPR
ncbi:hypothetical protein ACIA5C_24470 [Actinoplanes sp. NPDC051343]